MKANLTIENESNFVALIGAEVKSIDRHLVAVDYNGDFLTPEMATKLVKMDCGIVFLNDKSVHLSIPKKVVTDVKFI